MINTLNNLRLAQRSASLRGNTDPNQTIAQLQSILREALHVQSSGSDFFANRAVKELKQIRQDMVAGGINAGSRTGQIAGTYSHVIDQLEAMMDKSNKTQGNMDKAIDTIKSSFPSTDTLIGALMTANPILGYGVKIVRDINSSRKAAKARELDERKRRLAILEQQEQFINSQLELVDQQEEVVKKEEAAIPKKERKSRTHGLYTPLLEEIKKEINGLKDLINNDVANPASQLQDQGTITVSNSILERLESNREMIVSDLTQLSAANDPIEQQEDLVRVQEESADRIVDSITGLAEQERRAENARLRREKLTRTTGRLTPYSAPGHVQSNAVSEQKGNPFLGILTAIRALGMLSILGTGAGLLTALVSPIKAFFGFIGTFGKMLVRVGSKLLLPLAVLTMIYDFFEGFFDAAEFLGKNEGDVSLGDRIMVGISNIISGIMGIFDSIAELFGYDLFDMENMTKKVYDVFMAIPTHIMNFIDAIATTIESAYDEAVGSVVTVYDEIVNKFRDLYHAITGKVDQWIKNFNEFSLIDWMASTVQGDTYVPTDPNFDYSSPEYQETAKTQREQYGRAFGEITDPISNQYKTAEIDALATKIIAEQAAKAKANSIAVNAPTSNSTSVNNTIVQDRNTGNNNPRLKLGGI